MIAKTFEVRDRSTFIPVLAIKLKPSCEKDRYLLGRAGYGTTPQDQAKYVFLCRVDGGEGKGSCDPYDWQSGGARTMAVAHSHIIEHFDELESGAVVDVEYIQSERDKPKKSEADGE